MTGIWSTMVMTKKDCQRLADQTSSLRWGLIYPSQLIGLKKTSWDTKSNTKTGICVRSTESSTVDTTHCCEHRLNCSVRSEPGNISLRSRKCCQWLWICWVILCSEGMSGTAALETEFSSHTNEVVKLFIMNRESESLRWQKLWDCWLQWVSVRWKTKTHRRGIYMSLIHWVARGTGTPKNRDEVNKREVCECDGWVFDVCLLWINEARDKEKTDILVSVRWKTWNQKWGIYTSLRHWVGRGTRTPKDKDEVKRREVCECEGWVWDLDSIGDPSVLRFSWSCKKSVSFPMIP